MVGSQNGLNIVNVLPSVEEALKVEQDRVPIQYQLMVERNVKEKLKKQWNVALTLVQVNAFRMQEQPFKMFYKIDVLKNFSKFTVKHLYWNIFFLRVYFYRIPPYDCYS